MEVDGNDLQALLGAFATARGTAGKPSVIVVRTVPGVGVPFLEGQLRTSRSSARKTQRAHSITWRAARERAARPGTRGAAISECLALGGVAVRFAMIGVADAFAEGASLQYLLDKHGTSAAHSRRSRTRAE